MEFNTVFEPGIRYRHETSKDVHYLCVATTVDFVRFLPFHRRWNQSYELINVDWSRIDDKWVKIDQLSSNQLETPTVLDEFFVKDETNVIPISRPKTLIIKENIVDDLEHLIYTD